MTASVTEAVKANTQLDADAGKITVKATEGKGTMRAGRWDSVCQIPMSSVSHY